MILVTGAAGKTGRAVIRALATVSAPVRALVHRREQTRVVKDIGAGDVIVGDMRDGAVLERAMRGVRAVYHICPNISADEIAIGRSMIATARASGAEHVVYHSVLHPQTRAMPHHWHKLRVEEALFESGLAFTILQPASYMQNVLAGWRAIAEDGIYAVPCPVETRLSMVDLGDVALAARVVLTEPGHAAATYELAGPEALTQTQVAEILSRRLGRRVRAEEIAIDTWINRARDAGMGSYQIGTLVAMFRYYARHGLCGNPRVLAQVIGRPPVTFEAFVERTGQAGETDRGTA
jgi:NAD(P)H dehydrogenase (quinone)